MNGSDPKAQDAVDHTQVVGNMIVHTAGRRPAPVKVSAGQVLVAGFAGATVVGLDHSTDTAPATSSKIVFTRHGAPPQLRAFSGLHAINADGSNQTQLTHGYMDSNPAWSPDGTQVAFSRVTPGRWDEWGTRQLFRMRSDGSGVVALTRQRTGAGSINPTWSPDAAQIVFERPGAARTADGHTFGGQQLFIVNTDGPLETIRVIGPYLRELDVDGSGERQLSNTFSQAMRAAWSPDGEYVAFVKNHQGFRVTLLAMSTGAEVSLPAGPGRQFDPSWSPDGRQLAYVEIVHDFPHIHIMNRDGSEPRRITRHEYNYGHPSWSPDGRRIACHRWVGDYAQIHTMNADGSELTQLTSGLAHSVDPHWAPGFVPRRTLVLGPDGLVGPSGAGLIFAERLGRLTSLLVFDTLDAVPDGRAATKLSAFAATEPEAPLVVFVVAGGQQLGPLQVFDAAAAQSPALSGGVTLAMPPGTTGFVAIFSRLNGHLSVILSCDSTEPKRHFPVDGATTLAEEALTYAGFFTAAYDASGANVAPQGATLVRFDPKTGALVGAH